MNFTPLTLARNALQSDIVANLVGQRVVDLTDNLTNNGGGNFLTRAFNFGSKLVGFVIGALFNFVSWTLSDLWEFVVEAYFEVKHFDWNQTDQAIRDELANNDILIAGALGSLAGTGLVWLTGVAVSAGLSFKFPVVAGRVALALSEEGGDEIRAQLTNLILVSRNVAIQNFLMSSLLTARRYRLFGQEPVLTEKKPWTFADQIDETIESISSNALRAFATNFVDAVEDSIIEMGYVVAFTLDDHFEASQRANQSMLGQTRTVELTPDERVTDEQMIIEAPQELIIPTIQNAVNTHQMVHNRDLGQIVGMPETDYVTPRPQRRKLKVIFHSKQAPPWRMPDGSRAKTVETSIPDVRQGLTWQVLKQKIKKFTWGEHRVTAVFDNGRQMTVYGSSVNEAEQQILELASLNNLTIIRTTQGRETNPTPNRIKQPTLVYPAYAKLIIGDVDSDGNIISNRRETFRIDLWVDSEPENLTPLL